METCVNLPVLKSLSLTSTDLLRIPKQRQASPPQIADLPAARRNFTRLPVVSEDDLVLDAPFRALSRLHNAQQRNLYRDVRKIMEGSDDWEQLEEIISTEEEDEDMTDVFHFVEFCPN